MPLPRPASGERSPGYRFGLAVLLGLLLAIPLFAVYLLVYDRQSQSETARGSIVEGWGQPQQFAGPFLVIPFSQMVETEVQENGRTVKRAQSQDRALFVAPDQVRFETRLDPELRRRSIYQAVVYSAAMRASGSFRLPDLAASNIDPASLRMGEAEIRFGISSAKGLGGSRPQVRVGGRAIPLIPGSGLRSTDGSGFSGRLGAMPPGGPIAFDIAFTMRGHDSITLLPSAQDTRWQVASSWPHPSFVGGFLPVARHVDAHGFSAGWRIGNLALNRPVVSIDEQAGDTADRVTVALIDPVNLYSEVNRAVKYGFMFIGFTFLTLLMFDVIAGVPVSGVAYLLVGSGLILFFVLLLAFAEILGFTPAYVIASAAIVGLLACYSAAVLGSWRRAGAVAGLLAGLYAVLYVLLGLEAYSLLNGSLLLFAALAAVMYFTRGVDWGRIGGRADTIEA
ncbi:cell envelope integrity protein CreD [Sphingomonas profundi]|uniref:cell envelope integrity protein CreD n=1 Tax=Alterirhizorhabdus profundi TaxID=2681549 RepID=UPI0012E7EE61|nr:cell envelope integrity protein CreD [Sphingomonas profundi]